MKTLVGGACALLLAVASTPASATLVDLSASGMLDVAGAFTATITLDVENGQALSGSGTISILSYVNAPIALITSDTPDRNMDPVFGPIGYRANDGTDIGGFDQNYPGLTLGGLLFVVGSDVPASGSFPLFNIYAENGETKSFFNGEVDRIKYYLDTGTLKLVDTTGSAVPEPASWVMMIAGFGAIGGAMRRRRDTRVSFG